MKVVIDMCLPPVLVTGLNDAGHLALHWSEVGSPTTSDLEIMQWALEHECVILTHDMDFNALLYGTQGAGPSVVIFRGGDTSPESVLPPMLRVLRQFEAELKEGALISMGRHLARIRRLPLG